MRNNSFYKYPKWSYCSTNGISGGATSKEAILYATLELIERDSECCASHFLDENFYRPTIPLNTINSSSIQTLIDNILSANCELKIFLNPNEFNIPAFTVVIIDNSNVFYSNQGYAANLNSEQALISAIVEAAQGRLTMISGTREDNYRYDYNFIFDVGNTLQQRCFFELRNSKLLNFNEVQSFDFDDTHSALDFIFDKLVSNHFDKVLVADLSKKQFSFNVVKVLIPGLCGYHLPLNSRLVNYYNNIVKNES